MMGLIDVERLRDNDEAARELHRYDGKLAGAEHDLAGLEAQLAGSKRPQNGGMTGPSRGAENANNDALSDACEDVRENAPENAHRRQKNQRASYANGAVSAA